MARYSIGEGYVGVGWSMDGLRTGKVKLFLNTSCVLHGNYPSISVFVQIPVT